MGLFNRNKKQVSNGAVNRRTSAMEFGGLRFRFGCKQYAEAYVWMIVSKIFSGLANVRYTAPVGEGMEKLQRLASDLTENLKTIAWLWWWYGFVVVRKKRDGGFMFARYDDIERRKDNRGNILLEPDEVCIYSDTYLYKGVSDFDVLKHDIGNLDTLKNGLDYLTQSLGALGILSGKEMPIIQADKDEFNAKLKLKYGIREEQFQILLFDSSVDFKQMTLPIKDLELDKRIEDEVKLLAGYFGLPYDLLPISGQSTYANQEQALRQFYSNCVSPLAEVGLSLGRRIIKESRILVPSDRLSFTIDNVPELEDDRTAEIEYKQKVADLIIRMKEAGVDTTKYEKQLTDE